MKGKHTQITIELFAWTIFLGFPLIFFPTFMPFYDKGYIHPVFVGVILTHCLLIAFYYFNLYYSIPRYYFTLRFRRYALTTACSLLSLILILQLHPGFNPFPTPPFRFASLFFMFTIFIRFLVVFLLSLGIAHIKRLQKAEREKLNAELSYLKAQINPHFLFNTLNSLYALTFKKSDKAPEAVSKLSAIMRYVITEASHELVGLEKEISYVSAYIDLEKLRLTEKTRLVYEVNGDLSGRSVAPLLLIPLIENAFKYGISTTDNSFIDIRVGLADNRLTLAVHNTKTRTNGADANGVGLDNVKRRLNLLYPGRHTLEVTDGPRDFSVNLAISLDDQLYSHR